MNFITRLIAFFQKPVVERAVKTFIEATAAQAALYTTVIPSTPGVKGAAGVSAGATLLSILWNSLVQWAATAKSKKLDALAAAIDKAVDARLAAQAEAQKVPGNTPSA